MNNMKQIDRAACRLINEAIEENLREFAEERGLKITIKGGTFDGLVYRPKVEFAVLANADGKSAEQVEFERVAKIFGVKPEAYGAKFTANRVEYSLIGLLLKSTKYCVLGVDASGRKMKFTESVLINAGLLARPQLVISKVNI